MEKHEFDALVKELNQQTSEAIKRELKDATAGLIKADELAASLGALGIDKSKIDELVTAVEKQGDKINEMIEATKKPERVKSIGEQVHAQAEKLKALGTSATGKTHLRLDITPILDMHAANKATVLNSSISTSKFGMLEPGFNNDPFRLPVFRSIIPNIAVSPNSNGIINYTEQDTVTRGAAARTEGNQAAASTLTWVGRTASLCNISDSIKMTKEGILDIAGLERELQAFIELNLMLKEDTDLWSGDGNAPNLKGLYTYGTAYAASGVKYGAAPTYYDLIADMKLQVETGYNGKYAASHVVMNNQDAQKMWSLKDTNGNYIVPWFVNPSAKTVWGMQIVESSIVTQGTMLVGDMRHARLYIDSNIELEFGYDGNDFTYRLVTLVGNLREYLLIKNIDALAFIKSADIVNDTAALAESQA